MLKGIWDRLFGSGEPPAMTARPNAGSSGDGGGTRHQHYVFAHGLLPQTAHRDPALLLSILSGGKREEFLLGLWADARTQAPDEVVIPPAGLAAEVRQSGDRSIALITMPNPERVPEAYFAAVVFLPADDDGGEGMTCRYLTLEYGFTMPGDPRHTIFGGWTPDGTHHNFGKGPPAELEAFYDRVCGA